MRSVISLLIAATGLVATARAQQPSPAAELYKAGRLAEAHAAATASSLPADVKLACRLALYANNLAKARTCLRTYAELDPADRTVSAQLAEAEYRSRNFAAAAAALDRAGRAGHALRLRHFGTAGPYVNSLRGPLRIPFVRLDPLPVISARINGGPPLNFVIDTGAADTIIDPEVAKVARARQFGEQSGLFAGGSSAVVTTAAVDRISIAGLDIGNVPVTILPTERFSEAFAGLPIAGVIGTGLMSQFLSTLDYPGKQLVLRPRGGRKQVEGAAIPMWLLGDHYILVEGSLEQRPQLAFIDTGLAGLGCTVPKSTFDQARPATGAARPGGIGGAGDVGNVVPFEAAIALGPVARERVSCIFGPFPSQLETLGGTRIGMLVSHGFLTPYAVTFDFDRMKLILDGVDR